jgi:hypothetical protein
MWTGVIVLLVVVFLAALAWWFMGPGPKKSGYSRGGPGIQPGRDHNM